MRLGSQDDTGERYRIPFFPFFVPVPPVLGTILVTAKNSLFLLSVLGALLVPVCWGRRRG